MAGGCCRSEVTIVCDNFTTGSELQLAASNEGPSAQWSCCCESGCAGRGGAVEEHAFLSAQEAQQKQRSKREANGITSAAGPNLRLSSTAATSAQLRQCT